MPKVLYNSDGSGRVIFDHEDFLAGIAPQFTNNSNKKIGRGAMFMREFDPFRQFGYASPGFVPADVTTVSVIDALQVAGIVDVPAAATPYAYTIGGTKIHRLNVDTDTYSSDATWPRAIAGSTMSDAIIYRIGTTKYLFYSYYDGTDLEIGRYDLAATFVDTYWSGTLSLNSTDQNVPHPMAIGQDGILYIGDGRDLASLDGTDGTANGTGRISALALPAGFVITSLVPTRSHLVIFAYKAESNVGSVYAKGEAKAFFWDYRSDLVNYVYDLDDNYVNGGFIWNGGIGCFTYGRGKGAGARYAAMKLFNGTSFYIPDNVIFNDNIPRHGGVEIQDNMVHWNADGKIYSYGSPFSNFPAIFVHRTTGDGTSTGGLLRNFNGNKLYASSGITTAGGMNTLNTDFNSNCSWTSLMVEPDFGPFQMGEITMVRTRFAATVSAADAASLALIIRTDMGANSNITVFTGVFTITVQTTAESSTSKRILSDTIFNSAGARITTRFSSIGIACNYSAGTDASASDAPTISSVEIHFKPVNFN